MLVVVAVVVVGVVVAAPLQTSIGWILLSWALFLLRGLQCSGIAPVSVVLSSTPPSSSNSRTLMSNNNSSCYGEASSPQMQAGADNTVSYDDSRAASDSTSLLSSVYEKVINHNNNGEETSMRVRADQISLDSTVWTLTDAHSTVESVQSVTVGCGSSSADACYSYDDSPPVTSGHACAGRSGDSETNDVNRFNDAVQIAYEQVVLWRRNLFNIPYGSSGAKFVDELAALIHGFTGLLPSKRTSWKAVCVACHVLLQKPTSAGSNATYSQHLERRLGLWRSDRFPVLPEESACIQ